MPAGLHRSHFWDLHWFFPQSSLQHGSRYDVADDSNADSGGGNVDVLYSTDIDHLIRSATGKIPAASGLSNFVRIMCGGMGASIMTTMWDSRSTMHHAHITESTGYASPVFVQSMQGLTQQGMSDHAAYAVLDRTISVQASTMAATDIFICQRLCFSA
jgi:hypothetical protein